MAEPSKQPSLIRVGRKTVDLDHAGADLAFGTMDANDGFAVDQFAAEGAPGLIADEDDRTLRARDVVDEVMLDAPARTHPRTGQDGA